MIYINNVDELVNKLTELKDNRKWSNYRIAKESGLPVSTVSNIYKRKTAPQFYTFCLICNGFGISLSDFFCDDRKFASLNQREKELLKLINLLDDEQQELIINIMKIMNKA